jgi:hypothetical protein
MHSNGYVAEVPAQVRPEVPAPHRPERRRSSVGGPVRVAWREGTLTRAKELESLSDWLGCTGSGVAGSSGPGPATGLFDAIDQHLDAARQAARHGRRRFWRSSDGPLLERAISNLDAAQANLLQVAPAGYVLGQMPSLLNQVQRHLPQSDPRRQAFEQIALALGIRDSEHPRAPGDPDPAAEQQLALVEAQRNTIVSIVRGAGSAGLREQLRVRSFRNVLIATTGVLTLLAAALALIGWLMPAALPLCFEPQQSADRYVAVCPIRQSEAVSGSPGTPGTGAVTLVADTASRADLLVVELVGLVAAAVAAAAAVRRIRGSSEPHSLPVVLALLKLPTGALTAVLGLLLLRGAFLPGLSALDTSGQIVAWAVVFGYAQQLFTRFVDQQADSVLDSVRSNRSADGGPSV